MFSPPSDFEHHAFSLPEIETKLRELGADRAVLKILPRNANDKNQIYVASSFSALYNNFDLTLADRGASTSRTKDHSIPGSNIPEAKFNSFEWVKRSGARVRARNVKVIVYTQFPEARLSGFQTVENTMPQSLSVTYTKANPDKKRLLILGRLPGGACVALVYLDVTAVLAAEIAALPGLEGSRVCKILSVEQSYGDRIFAQLARIVSRPLKGCRLDGAGNTLPFAGTQVCGYTLEHALGIVPNSDKAGDLYGVELKTHTQIKVTLFTPEPDFGLYAESFEAFMRKYGYESGPDLRLTGVHRANERCGKSGLTLYVREYRREIPGKASSDWIQSDDGTRKPFPYDPRTSLTSKMGAVEVVLTDDIGYVAAGWSLERLMNNWGVKHNEVIYLSAIKAANPNTADIAQGFAFTVTFSPKAIWCRETSTERLLDAIESGLIFLDPAPKFVSADPSKNKRRAQWRVNDITKAVHALYKEVEIRDISANQSPP